MKTVKGSGRRYDRALKVLGGRIAQAGEDLAGSIKDELSRFAWHDWIVLLVAIGLVINGIIYWAAYLDPALMTSPSYLPAPLEDRLHDR